MNRVCLYSLDVLPGRPKKVPVGEVGAEGGIRNQRVVSVARERLVDFGDHLRGCVGGLVGIVIEAEREHSMRQLQPLRTVSVIDLVTPGQIGGIDRTVASPQQHDGAVQESLHLLIRKILSIVVEFGSRLVDRFLDDDLAMKVGQHLPAPRLQYQPDTEEIPALLGRRLGVHVDEILPQRPVDVAPLHRAVITGRVVAHPAPGRGRTEGRRCRQPLLRVVSDVPPVVLGRCHHPVQHRREVQIRRNGLGRVRIGIYIEVIAATN